MTVDGTIVSQVVNRHDVGLVLVDTAKPPDLADANDFKCLTNS
jgi:hypothetical protein